MIGLAISGGVDSMALAALCSRLQAASRSQDGEAPLLTEFRAFVVDHGVREGSNDEANSVAKIMAEKGICDGLKLKDLISNSYSQVSKPRFYKLTGKVLKSQAIRQTLNLLQDGNVTKFWGKLVEI